MTKKLSAVIRADADTTRKDYGSGVFDLSDFRVTLDETTGAVVSIEVMEGGDTAAKTITFDENGNAWMKISVNGAVTYVEVTDSDGWLLPNGVRIFYKQAFIDITVEKLEDESTIVTQTIVEGKLVHSEDDGGHTWLLLEEPDGSGKKYHIVERIMQEDKSWKFEKGGLYDIEALTVSAETRKHTSAEAADILANRLISDNGGSTYAEGALQQAIQTGAAGASMYLANNLKDLVTDNIKVYVTLTSTEVKDSSGTSYIPKLTIDIGGTMIYQITSEKEYSTEKAFTRHQVTMDYRDDVQNKVVSKAVRVNNKDCTLRLIQDENGSWSARLKTSGSSSETSVTLSQTGNYFTPGSTDLKNTWFVQLPTDLAQAGQTVTALKQLGTGQMADGNLNGGWIYDSGKDVYRFVQSVDQAAGNEGILLINGDTIALFADGSFGYVKRSTAAETPASNVNLMTETISISPEMQNAMVEVDDTDGTKKKLIETNIQTPVTQTDDKGLVRQKYIVRDKKGNFVEEVFLTVEELSLKTSIFHSILDNIIGYTYTPVYNMLSDLVVVTPVIDSSTASGAYVSFLAGNKTSDFAAPRDDDGFAIIDRFTRVVDSFKKNGHTIGEIAAEELGLTAEDLGLAQGETAALPEGTLIFLNSYDVIVAYMLPDGTFRMYETAVKQAPEGSAAAPAQGQNAEPAPAPAAGEAADPAVQARFKETYRTLQDISADCAQEKIYAEYAVDGSGLLKAELSKGARTYLMELASDVFVAAHGLRGADGSWLYDDADYFGYSEGGSLVLMTKDRNVSYTYADVDGAERMIEVKGNVTPVSGKTETAIRLKADDDSHKLDIISSTAYGSKQNPKDRAVFVMKDGTLVDSRGIFSTLVYETGRDLQPLSGMLNVKAGKITGGEIVLDIRSSDKAAVTVSGADAGMQVVSDVLVILAEGSKDISYGTSSDRMKISPAKGKDTTHVIFRKKAEKKEDGSLTYTGAFNGKAFLDITGSVTFQNSASIPDGATPRSTPASSMETLNLPT